MKTAISAFAATALATGMLIQHAEPAAAQLNQSIFRANNGQIYAVLSHAASADAGIGIDEVRITTIAASATGTTLGCAFPGTVVPAQAAEGWAFAGAAVIKSDLSGIRTSTVIDDATSPTFGNSGDGTVCIGPGCQPNGTCVGGASVCTTFTESSGSLITSGTSIPVAELKLAVGPTTNCSFGTQASYSFGTGGGNPTLTNSLCTAPPSDGFVLDSSASSFSGGIDGQTIVFVYDNLPTDPIAVAAAGFGVESDAGGFVCLGMSNVVVNAFADQDTAPPPFLTPTPTATPTATHTPADTPTSTATATPAPPAKDLQKCQDTIAKVGRVYATKVIKAIQKCRKSVFAGKLAIDPTTCPTADAKTAEKIAKAGLKARDKVTGKCTDVLVGQLSSCAGTVDGLVNATGDGGCIITTHTTAVLDMIQAEYGD